MKIIDIFKFKMPNIPDNLKNYIVIKKNEKIVKNIKTKIPRQYLRSKKFDNYIFELSGDYCKKYNIVFEIPLYSISNISLTPLKEDNDRSLKSKLEASTIKIIYNYSNKKRPKKILLYFYSDDICRQVYSYIIQFFKF